jgi:hypothetical protein
VQPPAQKAPDTSSRGQTRPQPDAAKSSAQPPADGSLGTATPAANAAIKGARGGGAGKPGSSTAASNGATVAATAGAHSDAATALPPITFERLKLLVLDGTRSREQDAIVHLSDGRIIIVAVGDRLVANFPYKDALTLSTTRSRQPRWRNADGTESGADLPGGAFGFLKSDRTWFAIQTRTNTYVLRADRDQIDPLMRAASDRTGLQIVRMTGK